jgi:hypothetical protein
MVASTIELQRRFVSSCIIRVRALGIGRILALCFGLKSMR